MVARASEELRDVFASGNSRELRGHHSKVHSVAWSCDGCRLASGSVDKNVRIWNAERNYRDVELTGHSSTVDQVVWDPTNRDRVASASGDKTVRIWDARSGKCTHMVATEGENINLTWAPDGKTLAVGDKHDVVSFVDARKFKIIDKKEFAFEVNEISWSPNSDFFFMTTGSGAITISEYPSLKTVKTLQAHTANCISMQFDPTGNYFAVGAADAIVTIWDLSEMCCIRTIDRLNWPVRTCRFSFDGKMLASGSEDNFIDVCDVLTGEQLFHIPVWGALNTLAWHPSQYLVAYAGDKDHHGKASSSIRLFGAQ
eukprot:Nk52_evm52s164 gene=Nk52_evmTU52s164